MLRDQPNKLHVSVTLKKIETGVEGAAGATRKSDLTAPIPVSDYSIAQLFSKIKPDEVDFLKYIPDGFLTCMTFLPDRAIKKIHRTSFRKLGVSCDWCG